MKKLAIAAALAAVISAPAMALDFTATAGRTFSDQNRNTFGLSVGQQFKTYGVTAGYERSFKGANDVTAFTLVGSYDVAKVGSVPLTLKAGATYLNPQVGEGGVAALVGVGTSVPLAKDLALTVDYRYQIGQSRVNYFNGNTFLVGIKYSL